MNDHIYKVLVLPWIPKTERPILQRQDGWVIGYKRIRSPANKMLYVDIVIHTGTPCYRHCLCKYFPLDERHDYFWSILCSPRSLASL
jgi:hypothetical protein